MLVPGSFFQEGGGRQGLEPFLDYLKSRGDGLEFVVVPAGESFVGFACRELARGGLDLVWTDSIYSGVFAPYAFDLNRLPEPSRSGFFPQFMAAHTHQGKLVALPVMADVGVLVYRRDLLRSQGEIAMPADWSGLADLARRVQLSRRQSGERNFWGFWFRAEASENLTALLLEWSQPGASESVWEDPERYLSRAGGWLQTIVPKEALHESEADGVRRFLADQLFMIRTWVQGAGVIQSLAPASFEVELAQVPGGGALGGHGVMVAASSQNAVTAAHWLEELTSYRFQRSLALASRLLPARMVIYSDAGVKLVRPEMVRLLPLFVSARLRPYDTLGPAYPEFSRAVQLGVRSALADPANSGRAAAGIRRAYDTPASSHGCSN